MAWQIHIAQTKNVHSIFVLCWNSVCMPFFRWMHSILNDIFLKKEKLKARWMNEWMDEQNFRRKWDKFLFVTEKKKKKKEADE